MASELGGQVRMAATAAPTAAPTMADASACT